MLFAQNILNKIAIHCLLNLKLKPKQNNEWVKTYTDLSIWRFGFVFGMAGTCTLRFCHHLRNGYRSYLRLFCCKTVFWRSLLLFWTVRILSQWLSSMLISTLVFGVVSFNSNVGETIFFEWHSRLPGCIRSSNDVQCLVREYMTVNYGP